MGVGHGNCGAGGGGFGYEVGDLALGLLADPRVASAEGILQALGSECYTVLWAWLLAASLWLSLLPLGAGAAGQNSFSKRQTAKARIKD